MGLSETTHIAIDCDDDDIRTTLQHALSRAGYIVSTDKDASYTIRINRTSSHCRFYQGDTLRDETTLPLHLHHYIEQIQSVLHQDITDISCGAGWLIDRRSSTLRHRDRDTSCRLTEKELAIICHLAANPEGVARDILDTAIWNHHPDVSSNTSDTHLYRLRQKLAALGDDAPHITVEDGVIALHDISRTS